MVGWFCSDACVLQGQRDGVGCEAMTSGDKEALARRAVAANAWMILPGLGTVDSRRVLGLTPPINRKQERDGCGGWVHLIDRRGLTLTSVRERGNEARCPAFCRRGMRGGSPRRRGLDHDHRAYGPAHESQASGRRGERVAAPDDRARPRSRSPEPTEEQRRRVRLSRAAWANHLR
jgi:hypothetical protein